MKEPLLKMLLVALGHITVGFCLYRWRILHKEISILHSDFLILGLPALLAFGSYTFVLRAIVRESLPRTSPMAASLALAFMFTIASGAILYYVAFSRYGT